MIASIVPLKAILFQTLFLLAAIAVESSFIHEFLKYPRKTSLEYAIPMNLFSTVVGWLMFFTLVPFADPDTQIQFMEYIFLNQVSPEFQLLIGLIIIGLFAISLGLKILMFFLLSDNLTFPLRIPIEIKKKLQSIPRKNTKAKRTKQVILWGHSCSHMIILFILFIVTWKTP